MQFQPSHHSLVVPPAGYEGVLDVFTREGRAEIKARRARKLRGKARAAAEYGDKSGAQKLRKRASKKEMRASALKAKAQGRRQLTPKDSPQTLWGVKESWGRRKYNTKGAIARLAVLKTRADALRDQALGYRPLRAFIDIERRATIAGGLQALQAAEVGSWVDLDLSDLAVQARGQKPEDDKQITSLVRTGSEGRWTGKGLQSASEFIRKEVQDHDLGKVAWGYRGLLISEVAKKRMSVRSAIEGASAAALGTAATIAATSSVGPQIIITGPTAAILGWASAGATAMAARSRVEMSRTDAAAAAFQQMIQAGLEEKGMHDQAMSVAVQQRQALRLNAMEEHLAKEVAALRAQEQVQSVRILACAGTVALLVVGGAYIFREIRT